MGRRKGGRCRLLQVDGAGAGNTDRPCVRRDLKVTFCQAARAARQGMDPNANVGYRSCFVPSCGCSCCRCCCCCCYNGVLCAQLPTVAVRRYFTLLDWPPRPGRKERGRYRDTCVYIATVRAARRYVSACRLSTLTLQPHTSTSTSASLECLA